MSTLLVPGERSIADFSACFLTRAVQDTVCAESGNQVYLNNYIQGAVDYIFGQHAVAWFQGNTLASIGPGAVTAAGRPSSSDPQLCNSSLEFPFVRTI